MRILVFFLPLLLFLATTGLLFPSLPSYFSFFFLYSHFFCLIFRPSSAIMDNAELFAGKRVLDVGTGSGILALWAAQAGATKASVFHFCGFFFFFSVLLFLFFFNFVRIFSGLPIYHTTVPVVLFLLVIVLSNQPKVPPPPHSTTTFPFSLVYEFALQFYLRHSFWLIPKKFTKLLRCCKTYRCCSFIAERWDHECTQITLFVLHQCTMIPVRKAHFSFWQTLR